MPLETAFRDPEVEAARSRGGIVHGARLTILLPRVFGFCGGVTFAVKSLAAAVSDRTRGPIWLLGELIHNDTVNDLFRDAGVCILPESELESVFTRADPGDTIVVPAFGIPDDLEGRLRHFVRSPDCLVDTTCAYVRRIWDFAKEAAAEGRTVIVHGKPDHPETRATLSRSLTAENAVIVLPDRDAGTSLAAAIAKRSPDLIPGAHLVHGSSARLDHLAIVHQTTMLHDDVTVIDGLVHDAVHAIDGSLVAAQTICTATRERQAAAIEVCDSHCDLIFVIGGLSSSNTNQLYGFAKAAGPAYFLRSARDISSTRVQHWVPDERRLVTVHGWLRPHIKKVGVLAGASCPACDIGNLLRILSTL